MTTHAVAHPRAARPLPAIVRISMAFGARQRLEGESHAGGAEHVLAGQGRQRRAVGTVAIATSHLLVSTLERKFRLLVGGHGKTAGNELLNGVALLARSAIGTLGKLATVCIAVAIGAFAGLLAKVERGGTLLLGPESSSLSSMAIRTRDPLVLSFERVLRLPVIGHRERGRAKRPDAVTGFAIHRATSQCCGAGMRVLVARGAGLERGSIPLPVDAIVTLVTGDLPMSPEQRIFRETVVEAVGLDDLETTRRVALRAIRSETGLVRVGVTRRTIRLETEVGLVFRFLPEPLHHRRQLKLGRVALAAGDLLVLAGEIPPGKCVVEGLGASAVPADDLHLESPMLRVA